MERPVHYMVIDLFVGILSLFRTHLKARGENLQYWSFSKLVHVMRKIRQAPKRGAHAMVRMRQYDNEETLGAVPDISSNPMAMWPQGSLMSSGRLYSTLESG